MASCRTLNDGARVANLSIATDDGYKGRDGTWVKRTTWHRLTVFGDKRVDYIEQNYDKGALIQFTGRLGYSQAERGDTKYHNVELIGSISLLASTSRDEAAEPAKPKARRAKRAQEPQHTYDDEVPL